MRRILFSAAAALAVALGLAAAADAAVKETIEETYSISSDGRVSVENVNGSIDIIAWDRSEVFVRAFKKARHKSDLQKLEVEIDASSDYVRIRTHHGHHRGWMSFFNWFGDKQGTVRYEIKVPRGVRLNEIRTVNGSIHIRSTRELIDAQTVNGTMTLEDVGGPLQLSTVNGSMKAQVSELTKYGDISMNSVNGSVRLDLPQDASAEISVKSVNGSIDTDFAAQNRSRFFVGRSMRTTIGGGAADVDIHTVNGSVRIRTDGAIRNASR
jgi:DUF4097 and DUF4098 domain-containing protein YvlB